jgi:hypothetical protein
MASEINRSREWRSWLAYATAGFLLFETLSGLSIWLLPFSIPNQWMVIWHTAIGLAFLVPCSWYSIRHWLLYRHQTMTHIKLLGYGGVFTLLALGISGVWLTYQAVCTPRISYAWDMVHIIGTFAVIALALPHIALIVVRDHRAKAANGIAEALQAQRVYGWKSGVVTIGFLALVGLAPLAYRPMALNNEFPPDYSFRYGADRPFAPSLSRTETGGAMDPRLFAGSESCGTSGCHPQIVEEWRASAHRYAAMDAGFQAIQLNMAKQNGPESTRYCGGCHDPISLFSGSKNIFTDAHELTALAGYQEGVSCLVCHSVKETDLKGNAAYVIARPTRYLFELEYDTSKGAVTRLGRDFLIRSYPRQHVDTLSKRLFKAPEYCAACHKQFIDTEINRVGWVQLQNQYDNWRKSRWNHDKDPRKTIECRECHMMLNPSQDPASGDAADYNRSPEDNTHRSHRFIASNQMMPQLLKLPGWERQVELTHQWLKGDVKIPEIADKWASGPAVALDLVAPEKVRPGETVDIKAVITSNKVGHDFPTGPLDIIQSWVELVVQDDSGQTVFATGTVDDKGFIKPGSFIFKAEPVDQYGNLIDRHNLWEMVGVRHRRALFPGFSDTAEFNFLCPDLYTAQNRSRFDPQQEKSYQVQAPSRAGSKLTVKARLCYRKIDQYLLNFIFGEKAGLTSPITEMASAVQTIDVVRTK